MPLSKADRNGWNGAERRGTEVDNEDRYVMFDNDPKASLELKLRRATDYYCKKHGSQPDLVFVHPSMMPGTGTSSKPAPERTIVAGVEVRSTKSVLPNHFWIGLESV